MDRTLFSPSMIDTFRACQRAYEIALSSYEAPGGRRSVPSICRQFIRKGLAEINRRKIINANEVQTFMGRHWPLEQIESSGVDADIVARAFLHSYKTLMSYARTPYLPKGAEIVAVALKARSRVPHVRTYLEDTFDLILWYPSRKHLEIVEYQLRSKRHFSAAWPTVSALTKRFLCERLRVRWPFESVSLTTIKIGGQGVIASNTPIEESIYQIHFEQIVKDLEAMKCPSERPPHAANETCKYCQALSSSLVKESSEPTSWSLSA